MCVPVIPGTVLGKLRQEDSELEATLGNLATSYLQIRNKKGWEYNTALQYLPNMQEVLDSTLLHK